MLSLTKCSWYSSYTVELAVSVIRTLGSHCAKEFLLLARDVIMSEHKLLSQQKSSCFCSAGGGDILLALLSPDGGNGQAVMTFQASRESVLGDTGLTAFLELLAADREDYDDRLVGEAYELLKQRTLASGIDVTPRVSTPCSDHVTDDVKFLAKALLRADSAEVPSGESLLFVGDSVPACANSIPACTSSIPAAHSAISTQLGNQSLSIMLSALEDTGSSCCQGTGTSTCHPPFCIREELVLCLMRFCTDQRTPSCVQLLLHLCQSSECSTRHFEESFLREFCLKIQDGQLSDCDTSLSMVGHYLMQRERGVESVGGALKVIRKLAMERCIEIMTGSNTEELQVC